MSIIYLSGLPRSGSTLLCNILNSHPQIKSSTSSPLCSLLNKMKSEWSDNPFLLSQLDDNFEEVYRKLKRSTKAFMEAWTDDVKGELRIDKNRGWVHHLETLRHLYPDFKIIITLRDLRNIYASIENQHRQTLLLDFPDHMEANNIDRRASALFNDNGVIGSCIKGLENIGDIPDISSHIFYWRYEDFLDKPKEAISLLFEWLEIEEIDFKPNEIKQTLFESDSYYHFKYRHFINTGIKPPKSINDIKISPRILNTIMVKFKDFYKTYYPEILAENNEVKPNTQIPDAVVEKAFADEEEIKNEIKDAIEKENKEL